MENLKRITLKQYKSIPKEKVGSPLLGEFKTQLDKTLENTWKGTVLNLQGDELDDLMGLFHL